MIKREYLLLILVYLITIPMYSKDARQVAILKKVEKICEELGHSFSYKREIAAQQLITFGSKISPFLARRYSKSNYLAKRKIVDIWQCVGDEKSVGFILRAINDTDAGVRMRVAEALLELSDRQPQLIALLKKITPRTRKERNTIQEIITTVSYKQVESELAKLISPYGGYSLCYSQYRPIARMGNRVIKPLLAMYSEDNYGFIHLEFANDYVKGKKMKTLAGYALTQLQDVMTNSERVMVLTRLRKVRFHKNPQTRRSVACILKKFGSNTWWNQIVEHDKKLAEEKPQENDICYHLGLMLLRVDRNYQAIHYFKKAISVNPDDSLAYYYLSCAHAKRNSQTKAINALRQAFKKGFHDYVWLKNDGDLRKLHKNPLFKELANQIEEVYQQNLLKHQSRN